MRPRSIVAFDWLYLGALALTVALSPWTIAQGQALFRANPAMAQFESFGRVMLIVSLVVGLAISLVLWYFISRRASNVAKWICVALIAYGALSAIKLFVDPVLGQTPSLATLPLYALNLAAVYCLFRKDAVAWFEGKAPVDPDDFR